jgi:hypothetical protein
MIYKILNLLDGKIPFNHVSAQVDYTPEIDDAASVPLSKTHQFKLTFDLSESIEIYQEKLSCPSVTSLNSLWARL